MYIKRIADKLAEKYQTRDPFAIAEALGFITLFVPLNGVRGFFQRIKRCNLIYIDEHLDDQQKKLVCAHELWHGIEHRKFNRIFLNQNTYQVTGRYEKEANCFAACLLFDDDEVEEIEELTIPQISRCWGVSSDICKYRVELLIKTKSSPSAATLDEPSN